MYSEILTIICLVTAIVYCRPMPSCDLVTGMCNISAIGIGHSLGWVVVNICHRYSVKNKQWNKLQYPVVYRCNSGGGVLAQSCFGPGCQSVTSIKLLCICWPMLIWLFRFCVVSGQTSWTSYLCIAVLTQLVLSILFVQYLIHLRIDICGGKLLHQYLWAWLCSLFSLHFRLNSTGPGVQFNVGNHVPD